MQSPVEAPCCEDCAHHIIPADDPHPLSYICAQARRPCIEARLDPACCGEAGQHFQRLN